MAQTTRAIDKQRRSFLRAGTISLTVVDRDGVVLEINDIGLARLGLERHQVVGQSIFGVLPAAAPEARERIERVFTTGAPLVVEDDVLLPGGVMRFRSHVDPVLDEANRIIAVQIQSLDVTAEHALATSLREAKEKLSVIFAHSPYLILTATRAGIITYINRVGPGVTMEQVIGTDSHHFVKPEFHPRYDEVLRLLFDEGKASKFEFLDINETWWEATLVPVEHEGQVEQAITFSVDITEKRRAEQEQARVQEQMLHTLKLESLGVLAGGIAHDFNNLLLVITANTDLALDAVPANSPAAECLHDALKAAHAAADLCKQMLTYAGRGELVVAPVDLTRLVCEMAQLVAISISKGVVLERELDPEVPAIDADAAQIRQVVLNLITNASDAIGDRQGTISLRTRVERLDSQQLSVYSTPAMAAGEYVVLEVEDSGHGMDDATRTRMFEPFFSTRASGRGLGLSATLGIVRKHRGAMLVESAPGVGTRVRAVFPAIDGAAEVAAADDRVSPTTGRGVVLVVDDEPAVLKVTAAALAHAGYEVLTAVNGRDALERFEEQHGRIDLVLLDLTMPVLGGAETLRELRARSSSVPVIVMSGYAEHAPVDANARFLAKPFRLAELLELVGQALRPAT